MLPSEARIRMYESARCHDSEDAIWIVDAVRRVTKGGPIRCATAGSDRIDYGASPASSPVDTADWAQSFTSCWG